MAKRHFRTETAKIRIIRQDGAFFRRIAAFMALILAMALVAGCVFARAPGARVETGGLSPSSGSGGGDEAGIDDAGDASSISGDGDGGASPISGDAGGDDDVAAGDGTASESAGNAGSANENGSGYVAEGSDTASGPAPGGPSATRPSLDSTSQPENEQGTGGNGVTDGLGDSPDVTPAGTGQAGAPTQTQAGNGTGQGEGGAGQVEGHGAGSHGDAQSPAPGDGGEGLSVQGGETTTPRDAAQATADSAPGGVADAVALYGAIIAAAAPAELFALPSDMVIDYYGIAESDWQSAVFGLSVDSLLADEVVVAAAVDEAAASRIEDALNARMEYKAAEALTYSPEQHAVIQKGFVKREGLVIALCVMPNSDAASRAFSEAA